MKQQDDIYNAMRVIAAALADAEIEEDRLAASAYLVALCKRPDDVEKVTRGLINVLAPLKKRRANLRLVSG